MKIIDQPAGCSLSNSHSCFPWFCQRKESVFIDHLPVIGHFCLRPHDGWGAEAGHCWKWAGCWLGCWVMWGESWQSDSLIQYVSWQVWEPGVLPSYSLKEICQLVQSEKWGMCAWTSMKWAGLIRNSKVTACHLPKYEMGVTCKYHDKRFLALKRGQKSSLNFWKVYQHIKHTVIK